MLLYEDSSEILRTRIGIGDSILIDQSGTRTRRAGVLFNFDERGGEKHSRHDFLYIVNSRPFFLAAPSILDRAIVKNKIK
jgi:hypothetical protein